MKPALEMIFTDRAIEVPPMALGSREIGACVEFHGIVRELERGEALTGLHYEAYEPMARREMERACAALAEQFPVTDVWFIHRTGWVPVGEASMFVRVCAAHRGEALGFCGALIDEMKRTVPIWKRLPR